MSTDESRQAGLAAENTALRQRVEELEGQIAEYERTRNLLSEEYSFREAVIGRAAEGICVCHAIDEYPFVRFTVWNPRMVEMTGYSIDEINRVGWYQTMYTDLEVREKARARMAQMREGEDLRSEQWEIRRADGKNRVFNISTSILKTSDGLVHALALMQDVTELARYRRQLESQVTHLEGLLPICASCKKIRDGQGEWHDLEVYITDHSEAEFSHGICPSCVPKLYPDLV